MKLFKTISILLLTFIVTVSFSQCSSSKKLQDKLPLQIGQVSYQNWVAGIKGGGSGLNILIPVVSNNNNIALDSVYFKGKSSKLETKEQNKLLYIGRFTGDANQKQDIIMSIDPREEYGNQVPKPDKEIPFQLKENECVVSYKQGKTIKYFKIDNIIEKQPLFYPIVPAKKQ